MSKDAREKYCTQNSVKAHPLLEELYKETLERLPLGFIQGAPEAHHFCQLLARLIRARRCLDIGTLSGASAFALALAIPEDGEVITMDVSSSSYDKVGAPIINRSSVGGKIKRRIAPALQTLDELIGAGESGRFDLAFIDADKSPYPEYYEKCLVLLRPGGVIAIDNSLMGGLVYADQSRIPDDGSYESESKIVRKLNKRIHDDDRVDNVLLSMADGLHVVVKK